VVYDLPNRDCAALASNGEYTVANGGAEKYRAYITAIKQQLTAAGNQKFVIAFGMFPRYHDIFGETNSLLEPDSLGNLVTNMVHAINPLVLEMLLISLIE
jgi:cellulose 1,4-beta-cellobiosidase